VRAAAGQILERVERQIAELSEARDYLRGTLREWDGRLERTAAGTPARLLETLRPAAAPVRHALKRRSPIARTGG